MNLEFLPHVNACLNAAAAVLLVVGLMMIKKKRIEAHRNVMIAAFAMSIIFLIGYVGHKAWRAAEGLPVNTTFNHEGALKMAYLLILGTHLVLAMTVPVFAMALIWLGWKKKYDTHRKVARFGWPIWMYVSVTGVVIYFMLYHFNPQIR